MPKSRKWDLNSLSVNCMGIEIFFSENPHLDAESLLLISNSYKLSAEKFLEPSFLLVMA